MKPKLERRFFKTEVRASRRDGAGEATISGYAAVFNQEVELMSWFGSVKEMIMPGAFTRALQEKQDVRCLFNHDPNFILGRTKSGTLKLAEDKHGLEYNCEPPNSEQANGVVESIQRRDVDGSSFGFQVRKQEWSDESNEEGEIVSSTRKIFDVDLFDVSPVTFPAYPTTSSEANSLFFPEGVPAEMRAHFKKKRFAEDGCECDCQYCVAGHCDECNDPDCDDDNCEDCPMQGRSKPRYIVSYPADTKPQIVEMIRKEVIEWEKKGGVLIIPDTIKVTAPAEVKAVEVKIETEDIIKRNDTPAIEPNTSDESLVARSRAAVVNSSL